MLRKEPFIEQDYAKLISQVICSLIVFLLLSRRATKLQN